MAATATSLIAEIVCASYVRVPARMMQEDGIEHISSALSRARARTHTGYVRIRVYAYMGGI